MWKLNHNLNLKSGEYPYAMTEIFENIEFNAKERLTQY